MKLLNLKYKLILIILLVVIFVFAMIGTYNSNMSTMIVEGMENSTEEVPTCPGISDVPACYSTVQYEDYEQLNSQSNDPNYILKTQIVPPVCPACPATLSNHGHAEVDEAVDKAVDETEDETDKKTPEEEESENPPQPNPKPGQPPKPLQQQTQSQSQSQSQNVSNNIKVTTSGSNNSNSLQNQIDRVQNSLTGNSNNGQCPPCPACARCPEPAFTCQKVPNYRSTNIGSYLPIPVLNDFSTFN